MFQSGWARLKIISPCPPSSDVPAMSRVLGHDFLRLCFIETVDDKIYLGPKMVITKKIHNICPIPIKLGQYCQLIGKTYLKFH